MHKCAKIHPLFDPTALLENSGIIGNVNLISVDLCGNQMNHIPPASCPYKATLPDICLFHWDFCCASRLIICEFVLYLASLATDTITNEPLLAYRFTMPKVAQNSCLPKTVENCSAPFMVERVRVFL